MRYLIYLFLLFSLNDYIGASQIIYRVPTPLSEGFYRSGNLNIKFAQYKEAEEAYLRAIKLNPHVEKYYVNLGYVYYITGQYKKALRLFDSAIPQFPSSFILYNNRANIYLKLNLLEKALTDINKAISIKPKVFYVYGTRANIFTELKMFDKAFQDYVKAIKLNPNSFYSYSNRGYMFFLKGHFDLALEDLDRAIQLNPDYAEAYYYRGNVYEKLGQLKKAQSNYKSYIDKEKAFAPKKRKKAMKIYQFIKNKERAQIEESQFKTKFSKIDNLNWVSNSSVYFLPEIRFQISNPFSVREQFLILKLGLVYNKDDEQLLNFLARDEEKVIKSIKTILKEPLSQQVTNHKIWYQNKIFKRIKSDFHLQIKLVYFHNFIFVERSN